MSALGNYIERAGVATVAISLVREQTEKVGTPRALWVPFPLGRPLGSAADSDFQTTVIRAALSLIESATGPTIADFEHDAPEEASEEPWACPVSFAPAKDDSTASRLGAEVTQLIPWSAETRRARGRTLFGASGAGPEQVLDVAAALAHIAETGDVETSPPSDIDWAFEMPLLIRHLADDLRTVAHEAIASRPGSTGMPDHDDLNDWIFGGTTIGEVFQQIAEHLTANGGGMQMLVRGLLIPEGRYRGGSAFPETAEFGHQD